MCLYDLLCRFLYGSSLNTSAALAAQRRPGEAKGARETKEAKETKETKKEKEAKETRSIIQPLRAKKVYMKAS